MPLFRAHPAPAAVVIAAVAAVAWVFVFARPQYRPAHVGHAVSGTAYQAPVRGWTWRQGLPGGDVTGAAAEFLLADVTAAELAPARAAAARAGLDPGSVRPLHVARYFRGPRGFAAILAVRGPRGRTCLGFVLPRGSTSFVCPRRQRAFVIATALPERDASYPLHVLTIASGDVAHASLTVHTAWTDMRGAAPRVVRRDETLDVYDKRGGWWGTFAASVSGDRGWQAQLRLDGAVLRIRLDGPGTRLFVSG